MLEGNGDVSTHTGKQDVKRVQLGPGRDRPGQVSVLSCAYVAPKASQAIPCLLPSEGEGEQPALTQQ